MGSPDRQASCHILDPVPNHAPLQLLLMFLLPSLSLHLLHLDGVGLPAAHVQLMVPHAELQDSLVNSQTWGIEHKVLPIEKGNLDQDALGGFLPPKL